MDLISPYCADYPIDIYVLRCSTEAPNDRIHTVSTKSTVRIHLDLLWRRTNVESPCTNQAAFKWLSDSIGGPEIVAGAVTDEARPERFKGRTKCGREPRAGRHARLGGHALEPPSSA